MEDSLYLDEKVLAVYAELVSADPFHDCVTGKRGHEHRGRDNRTKRRSGALEWSENKKAATAAKREAAAAAALAKRETVGKEGDRANILYGTTLKAEMDKKFKDQPDVNVGFYRYAPDGKVSEYLDKCNVVICSFESLHHIDGQRFDVILIDEIRTIAGLVGGATMPDFNNIYVMKELAERTAKIVVCDADLIFKMSPSETNTLTYNFMKLLFGSRPVLHGSLHL